MQRDPAVAGQFYPGDSETLRHAVSGLLCAPAAPRRAFGIVSPHAGYIYSGAIAGETFASVLVPQKVVILGPNHHGLGHPAAIYPSGSWVTPLGETAIDEELAVAILESCPGTAFDRGGHRLEHSLEVQLPFIQVRAPSATIVPICLGRLALEELLAMGEGLARVLSGCGSEVLIVASSDMSHYEPSGVAREKDMRAIDRILAVDPEGLYATVREGAISMCGVLPTVVFLAAARRLGATSAELVRYGHSGEVSGDHDAVVGYAGVVVPRGTN